MFFPVVVPVELISEKPPLPLGFDDVLEVREEGMFAAE